jgi:DNA-binding HxlR family transcriptional regulator
VTDGKKMVGDTACPIVGSVDVIGSKWKLLVIRYLADSPLGFNELLKRIGTTNSKELSLTLKQLGNSGLVERKVVSLQPFRVEYSLTQMGYELKPVLKELRKWGEKWRSRFRYNPIKTVDHH